MNPVAVAAGTGAAALAVWTLARKGRVGAPHVAPHRKLVGRDTATLAGGLCAGTLSAFALADPALAPLGVAMAWGAADLLRRVAAERQILERTRTALPFLQRVLQELEAGMHPVAALSWALQAQPAPPWLRLRIGALGARLDRGEALARAAATWAQSEEVPVLRLFAHLLATHALWGTSLGGGLRRILREADQSVAFGTEERTEHHLYEGLTLAFLLLDVVLGVAALAGWPHGVPAPTHTAWGRALLVGAGLLTALAVAVPVSLGSGVPPQLRELPLNGGGGHG